MARLVDDNELVGLLVDGGVAVVRTDTIYGLVARAADQSAVERVYQLKGRDADKACIILIASLDQLYDPASLDTSDKWPGANSIILPSPSAPSWLLRGGDDLAYRLPADEGLRQLIARTGPLIAPSANPQGQPPAQTVDQARAYFGDQVDGYRDGGEVPDAVAPSKLWRIEEQQWIRLR